VGGYILSAERKKKKKCQLRKFAVFGKTVLQKIK
jgi:hypothetical protein